MLAFSALAARITSAYCRLTLPLVSACSCRASSSTAETKNILAEKTLRGALLVRAADGRCKTALKITALKSQSWSVQKCRQDRSLIPVEWLLPWLALDMSDMVENAGNSFSLTMRKRRGCNKRRWHAAGTKPSGRIIMDPCTTQCGRCGAEKDNIRSAAGAKTNIVWDIYLPTGARSDSCRLGVRFPGAGGDDCSRNR